MHPFIRSKLSLFMCVLLALSTSFFIIRPAHSCDTCRGRWRMLLSQVETLHFRSNVSVSKNRLSWSPPALSCTEGGACSTPPPEAITCSNRQLQVENGAWQCTYPDMPPKACLINLALNCEGYAKDDDQYILRDSCALEYSHHLNCRVYGVHSTGHKRRTEDGGTLKREGKYLLGSQCGWKDFLKGLLKKDDIDVDKSRRSRVGAFIIHRRKQLSGETDKEESDTNE